MYTITGTLFNGISEGAGYGDDWQMSSNYPLVRLTSGTKVYYARSFNWNSTSVQTGNSHDTAQFTLPSGLPSGLYSLVVVANGIPSDSVTFSYYPCTSDSNAMSFLSINTGNEISTCNGTPINLSASSSGGIGNTTFNWMPGNLNGTSPAISPSASTNYTVTVSDVNGCTRTATQIVSVNPLPVLSVSGNSTVGPEINDTLTAHGGLTYTWSNGSTSDTAIVQTSVNATYTVTGIDANGCMDTTSFAVTINIPLGTGSETSTFNMALYPDPATNLLNLKFEMSEQRFSAIIKIVDVFGNELLSLSSDIGNDKIIQLDLSTLIYGMYFVRITGANCTQTTKFIKK